MQLAALSARQYRSLRAIRMELGGVNLFIGANGVGKSNLYRALQLVQAAVRGTFAREIAAEGGMMQALWAGPRRNHEQARIVFTVEVEDETNGLSFDYRIEAGLRPPNAAAGFMYEPQVKAESFRVDTGRGPVEMMKRQGPGIFLRDGRGRMAAFGESLLTSETAISVLAHEGTAPEISAFCRFVDQWRFFHGFRTDAASPLRHPCLAVTAPLLDEDGANLAAVFATLSVTREDTVELDEAIAVALGGARLDISEPETEASFGLSLPEFPRRIFTARELSDGQLRFLALAGALLSYRAPPLIALNEPESSLHPDMIEPLAGLIAKASEKSQIWIVTHSERLAEAVRLRCGPRPLRVVRQDGATWIEGMRLTGAMADGDDEA
ncbi:AAA family ATPase [Rhizobiaceae bacterium BDR2-2]|uniref:AAA family ATPase n=1 Tax=Ectorhizobium quercum TaxID=2965071 RepID=A0AAE3N647_9HYPH|nr:AAA family ATPase [Ectorhizobium quercum]MCX8999227.1 AAA family ATPase [Ectorhizobium quercum]